MSDEPALGDARALAIINPAAGKGAGERMSRRIAEDFRRIAVMVAIALALLVASGLILNVAER